jgi:16S rRNA (guanine527-N7)-methyltransferase
VVGLRAEEAGRHGAALREKFDVVACRAVATMIWLVEWCMPLTKRGGRLLAMKGPKGREELDEISPRTMKFLGGADPVIHDIALPGTDARIIIQIDKISQSHKRLPRDPTSAKGKPLP